jgi:hypothetical protein
MLLVFFFCAMQSKFKRFEEILEAKNPENDPVGVDPQNLLAYEAYRGTNLVYSFPSLSTLSPWNFPFNTLYCESRPYRRVQIDLAWSFSHASNCPCKAVRSGSARGYESSVGYVTFRHKAFLPEMCKRGHITTGITLEPSLQD